MFLLEPEPLFLLGLKYEYGTLEAAFFYSVAIAALLTQLIAFDPKKTQKYSEMSSFVELEPLFPLGFKVIICIC